MVINKIITCILVSLCFQNLLSQKYDSLNDSLVKYDHVSYGFYKNRLMVMKNFEIGFLNRKGKEIIPCGYEFKPYGVKPSFESGLCPVYKNGDIILIDRNGKKINTSKIKSIEQSLVIFENGELNLIYKGKLKRLDTEKDWYFYNFYPNHILLSCDDGMNTSKILFNNKGKKVMEYDNIFFINYGESEKMYFLVNSNDKYFIVNKKGRIVISMPLLEDVFKASYDGEYLIYRESFDNVILFDKKGNLLSDEMFCKHFQYKEYLFAYNGKKNFIFHNQNLTKKVKIGSFFVCTQDNNVVLRANKKILNVDYLVRINENFIVYKQNSKYGVVNTNGDVVFYDQCEWIDTINRLLIIHKEEGVELLDVNGDHIVEESIMESFSSDDENYICFKSSKKDNIKNFYVLNKRKNTIKKIENVWDVSVVNGIVRKTKGFSEYEFESCK